MKSHLPFFRQISFLFVCVWLFAAPQRVVAANTNDGFSYFIGMDSFRRFKKSASEKPGEMVLTSPKFEVPIDWKELIVSWNAETPAGTFLKIEARQIFPDHTTKFYTMGLWSEDPKQFPRQSVKGQKDADGNVDTDTLILNRPGGKAQVRVTMGSNDDDKDVELDFLGLSFCNTKIKTQPLPPFKAAWGYELAVIERSQNSYPDEKGWCSPTSISMVLTYWSKTLQRTDLSVDVPEIVPAIFDPNFGGTGNWPFNTAYAGRFEDMRAYVTRFSDIAEIEEWTSRGVPVVISSPWHLLKPGRRNTGGGHIVVVTGFTNEGDVVINDPGTSPDPKKDRVRHVFKRADVINAWSKSRNTVYLIYPEETKIPKDRVGHWEK